MLYSTEISLTLNHQTTRTGTKVGRLQAQVDGMLGSVCDYGLDEKTAKVACKMLGFER